MFKSFFWSFIKSHPHENDHLDGKLITDYATPSDLLEYKSHIETMRLENS